LLVANIPSDLYDKLQQAADSRQTSVVQLLRQFITIGLMVLDLDETPESSLVVRRGETEEKIKLVF
jgi:hypothetical protein